MIISRALDAGSSTSLYSSKPPPRYSCRYRHSATRNETTSTRADTRRTYSRSWYVLPVPIAARTSVTPSRGAYGRVRGSEYRSTSVSRSQLSSRASHGSRPIVRVSREHRAERHWYTIAPSAAITTRKLFDVCAAPLARHTRFPRVWK